MFVCYILLGLFLQIQFTYSKLIWFSFDSLEFNFFEKGEQTFLKEMASKGLHVKRLHPEFPSETFPNLFSAATGLRIEEHGVITNYMDDLELGPIKHHNVDKRWWNPKGTTLPIWTIVEKNGGKSAVIYWPGGGAEFDGTYPSFYFKEYNYFCSLGCRIMKTVELAKNGSYDLIMVYLTDYANTVYFEGPDSKAANQTINFIHKILRDFTSMIKDLPDFASTSIMVSGEHGTTAVSQEKMIVVEEFFGDPPDFGMVYEGPVGMFHCDDEVCSLIIKKLRNHSHVKFVDYKYNLPKEFRYSNNDRIPLVIVIMEKGWMITGYRDNREKSSNGYPWQWVDSMNSVLIGYNGKFKKGVTIESLEIPDVFTIACQILDLEDKCRIKRKFPYSIIAQKSIYRVIIIILCFVSSLVIIITVGIWQYKKKQNPQYEPINDDS